MRLALAGGQEEQPWLVKSSTTTGDFAAAEAGTAVPSEARGSAAAAASDNFKTRLSIA
jgi:hypothetical protein